MSQTLRESSGTQAVRGAVGRRFTIADGAVLVGATAAGFALSRAAVPGLDSREILDALGELLTGRLPRNQVLEVTAILVVPCLAAWTLALAAVGVWRTRPRRRRLGRRPGLMACLVAIPALAWGSGSALVSGLFSGRSLNFGPDTVTVFEFCADLGSAQAGAAVLACWATMALSGRWRPEPTWVDRLGRLLGVAWIGMAPLVVLFWPF